MQGKIQETIRISFNLKLTVLVESRVEDDVVTLNLRVIMKVVSKAIQIPDANQMVRHLRVENSLGKMGKFLRRTLDRLRNSKM